MRLARSSGADETAVVLLGPASPRDVCELLTGQDRNRALDLEGYRGVPTTDLARALVQAGTTVELITTAEEVDSPVTLEGERFRIVVVPRRPSARARATDLFAVERGHLLGAIRETSGSILHAMWTYEFAWAALSARPRATLITAHDAPLTVLRHNPTRYQVARTAMAYLVRRRARRLVTVSPYLARRWRREMLYRPEIEVVPNIAPQLPARARTPKPGLIVDVADSGRIKNLEALVTAVGRLRAEGREVELRLAGPGLAEDGAFAAWVRTLGASSVSFAGPLGRHEVADLLSVADIFVHPSLEESFGLSIVEAMSMGVPVVGGARSGAVPWLLAQGEMGTLADISDPQALAAAIREVLDDEMAARAKAQVAQLHVQRQFSAGSVAGAYRNVYRQLVQAGVG